MHNRTSTISRTIGVTIALGSVLLCANAFTNASQDDGSGADGHGGEATRKPECGEDIRDFAVVLKPGTLTMFGELHGTQEAPAFVANIACRAVRSNLAVRIGLEIPTSLQSNADAFLASEGSPKDIDALTQGPFWLYEDGRSSKAMLALFDKIRRLKQSGRDIDVYLFDVATMNMTNIATRDKHMAKNILSAIAKSPEAVHLVLTGNIHARTNSDKRMGWHIMQRHKQTVSLNISHSGGSAWVCTSRPLRNSPRGYRSTG